MSLCTDLGCDFTRVKMGPEFTLIGSTLYGIGLILLNIVASVKLPLQQVLLLVSNVCPRHKFSFLLNVRFTNLTHLKVNEKKKKTRFAPLSLIYFL